MARYAAGLRGELTRWRRTRFHRVSRSLKAKDELYRLRVGDYRVLYQVQGKVLLVLIVGMGHRRDIYRRIGG